MAVAGDCAGIPALQRDTESLRLADDYAGTLKLRTEMRDFRVPKVAMAAFKGFSDKGHEPEPLVLTLRSSSWRAAYGTGLRALRG